MTDTHQSSPPLDTTVDAAERLAEHLLRYPADLIDSYRLLRRFRVSNEDFQRALELVEQQTSSQSSESESRDTGPNFGVIS